MGDRLEMSNLRLCRLQEWQGMGEGSMVGRLLAKAS